MLFLYFNRMLGPVIWHLRTFGQADWSSCCFVVKPTCGDFLEWAQVHFFFLYFNCYSFYPDLFPDTDILFSVSERRTYHPSFHRSLSRPEFCCQLFSKAPSFCSIDHHRQRALVIYYSFWGWSYSLLFIICERLPNAPQPIGIRRRFFLVVGISTDHLAEIVISFYLF